MTEDKVRHIRERAHQLWKQGGRVLRFDKEHWERAEREIEAEDQASDDTPVIAS